jgi:hypothetical protein
MRESRTSGSMSGDGKRGCLNHRARPRLYRRAGGGKLSSKTVGLARLGTSARPPPHPDLRPRRRVWAAGSNWAVLIAARNRGAAKSRKVRILSGSMPCPA